VFHTALTAQSLLSVAQAVIQTLLEFVFSASSKQDAIFSLVA